MKEYDFFEKLYLAEITIRGQILTLFGLSLGITVAVASGLATQVASYPFKFPISVMTWVFLVFSIITCFAIVMATIHLYLSHKPQTYRLLDDALLYRDYFNGLKMHCEKYVDEGGCKTSQAQYDEWVEEDVTERLVDAASHNRSINYRKMYRLNLNHFWISIAALGTLVAFILKSIGP